MTTSYGPKVSYKCFNDCVQTGCPGHTLRVKYHNTSDVMFFEDERGNTEAEDPSAWRAKVRAWQRWHNGEQSDEPSEEQK